MSKACTFTTSLSHTFTDKPGAPENFKVTDVAEDTISVHWDPPSDNGGCLITAYVVEYREASKRSWQSAGTTGDVEMTLTRLTEGQLYMFRVAAENDVGTGPFVELAKAVAPKSKFGEY